MQIPLKDKHPVVQLIAFIGLSLISLIAVMLLGVIAGVIVWGSGFTESMMAAVPNADYVVYMKYMQILSHLGMFIIPALVFGRLAGGNVLQYFTLNKSASGWLLLLAVAMIVLSQPLINLLTTWNASMSLPESMGVTEAWMKDSEEQASAMTELFMSTTTMGGLIVNLLMMALIPAIGEELVFRGIVQNVLLKWFRASWLAILTTAIIFSAIHMQFYGFVPRLLLGLILGYAYFATGRLWVPMLIHFINNGLAVVVYWLFENEMISIDPDKFGNFNDNPVLLIAAVILFAGSCYLFLSLAKLSRNEQKGTI